MIFISYRQEDTKSEVTHLHRELVARYGEEQVFVDYRDIPPGDKWPDTLQERLKESCVLLAVIGPKWGDARFTTGTNSSRLRLDDPEDWVRQEICRAIQRGPKNIRVVWVSIDDAKLPATKWNCELDHLPNLQRALIRHQANFEHDFVELCRWLEDKVPALRHAADFHKNARTPSKSSATRVDPSDQLLRLYVDSELRNHASIQLPLISENGQPVIAQINELRIDLPLIISHEHKPITRETALQWIGREVLFIHEQFRSTHTNALLVDRASRHEDISRDCDISKKLAPGSRVVVVGDPGSGKSTLLQWIADYYGSRFAIGSQPTDHIAEGTQLLPAHNWLPLIFLCRDLAGQPQPTQLEEIFRIHLKQRQFSDEVIANLSVHFEYLLEHGQAILLIDGLDEIPNSDQRIEFCKLLSSVANRYPDSPIVITSRVVGFQAVRDELVSNFDHLLVGPLDRTAKLAFIERWSKLIGWTVGEGLTLVQQVCHSRVIAKLTENIFLLAMVAQIRVLDHELPGRRVDVYRRAIQLMIQRRRPFSGPPLSMNEVIPHLEYLGYWMRKKGVQRCKEAEVVAAFHELRRLESDEPILQTRSPEELLRACVDSLGLLNVAGTETDRRGFDRQVIQFFHQSFQEYFAGQAIKNGHDAAGQEGTVKRLRDLLLTIEIREREVNIWGEYKIVEPVIADYWQEAVRLLIADLKPDEADDAMLMLLPSPATPLQEARPRAIFALQCLVDEPRVSDQTLSAVFDAVIESLAEGDGFDTKLHTWMDEGLNAVSGSVFGERLRSRLIEDYINSYGDQRNRIGCCATLLLTRDNSKVTTENADAMIAVAKKALSSDHPTDQVRMALELMNRFYISDGKLSFLTSSQQDILLESFLSAFSDNEPAESAVMWALLWLTGAKNRFEGNKLSESTKPKPIEEFVLLDPPIIRKIEQVLKRPDRDPNTLAYGCLVLTRERGLDIVIHQLYWIHELARIADGDFARRLLPSPRPVGRSAPVEWIKDLLKTEQRIRYSLRIAQALGSFGVFAPEMIGPLRFLFTTSRYPLDERDEAMIYLALVGTSEAVSILIEAADTPPIEGDDYLYSRGLFGLLLLDNVDVLEKQIHKALPHSDLNAYAYGLAGSRDSRGRVLLGELKNHANERIRTAVARAFTLPCMSETG